MRNYALSPVNTFDVGDEPKQKVLKPLEEAAEVYGAWQNGDREAMADEIADCIQACCNLYAWMGLTQEDVDAAIERCAERNRKRGRL